MSIFSKIFSKKNLPFSGVKGISTKDFNDRRCPNCNKKSLTVDEYEKVPIAFCKKCNGEFQMNDYKI